MSTHPNVILLLKLTPDDLARKTYRAILAENNIGEDSSKDIKIDGTDYHHRVMEEDYDEGMQIAAKEGDIVVYDLVTYGYGEVITWAELEKQKNALAAWAQDVCARHHCKYEIVITANYW